MKNFKKRLEAAALLLALCALCLAPASAVSGSYDTVKNMDCSLTVGFAPDGEPMTNSTFQIWWVGTLSDGGCLPFREFSGYNVLNGPGSWSAKASTLLSYLQRDGVAPTRTGQTDADGTVRFDIPAAQQGLYLVAGESQWRDGTRYTPTPLLVTVPYTTDLQTWETAVVSLDKFTAYTPPETVQRHVLKSWRDGGHENERPASITVELLRDGRVFDTATLSAANSWRFDWTDLDARYQWTVVERENGRYAALVEQEGITFHITNTWLGDTDPDDPPLIDIIPEDPPLIDIPDLPDDPDNPGIPGIPDNPEDPDVVDIPEEDIPLSDGPKLPQTGQLWWPVAPLAMGGLMFLLIGWRRRRDWSESDEA